MISERFNSHRSLLTSHDANGISVISVIVTVVIIILLASLTVYSGLKMLNQAKEDRAYDRLEIIYQAIRANESDLNPTVGDNATQAVDGLQYIVLERTLSKDDYLKLGLEMYTRDNNMPEITFSKRIGGIVDTSNSQKRTYIIKDDKYEKSFEYNAASTTTSLTVDFDFVAGVNRPYLTENMKAINFSKSEDGEYVEDIFLDNWYSYDSSSPNYANVEINVGNSKYYFVWIPRFAYKIQDYYANNTMSNVPTSAIDIIFLKGTTNTDANDNALPKGYKVHPAFKYRNNQLTGIWVEKYNHRTSSNIANIYTTTGDFASQLDNINSHLLKNDEWGAVAYLAQTCGAAKSNVSSTGNYSGVCNINSSDTEYTATYIDCLPASFMTAIRNGNNENKNIYNPPEGPDSFNELNEELSAGDALVETSSGDSDKSAWYNSTTIIPTTDKPFIARGTGDSLFGYKSSNGSESRAYYRTTLLVTANAVSPVAIETN